MVGGPHNSIRMVENHCCNSLVSHPPSKGQQLGQFSLELLPICIWVFWVNKRVHVGVELLDYMISMCVS